MFCPSLLSPYFTYFRPLIIFILNFVFSLNIILLISLYHINTGSFPIDSGIEGGGVIFPDVGLFTRALCFYSGSSSTTAHKTWWAEWPSVSQVEGRTLQGKTQQQSKPNYTQRANVNGIRDIPRASSTGDQGDCATESHRYSTIEVHTQTQGVKTDQFK